MIESRITSKAQVTLPKAVRSALRVRSGDRLLWEIEEGRAILTRAGAEEDLPVSNFAALTEWADELDSVYDNL
jgi:antitoxin PrlF